MQPVHCSISRNGFAIVRYLHPQHRRCDIFIDPGPNSLPKPVGVAYSVKPPPPALGVSRRLRIFVTEEIKTNRGEHKSADYINKMMLPGQQR
jgi:hypothetical protein